MAPHTLEKLGEIIAALGAVSWFIFRFIVVPIADSLIINWLKPRLARTETEMINWLHWEKRARGTGHRASNVVACPEDDCAKITR